MNQITVRFIESVVERTARFLQEETGISVDSTAYNFDDVKKLQLKHLTSMMAVEGQIQVMFAFSFDAQLSLSTTKAYTAELGLTADELEHYIEDTAADIINIVLGNVLVHFQIAGKSIELTPPIVLSEAKTVYRKKPAQFLTAEMSTSQGELLICCIAPKELFDHNLDYKDASLIS
jgi:CheY-specific phosphatase CheX